MSDLTRYSVVFEEEEGGRLNLQRSTAEVPAPLLSIRHIEDLQNFLSTEGQWQKLDEAIGVGHWQERDYLLIHNEAARTYTFYFDPTLVETCKRLKDQATTDTLTGGLLKAEGYRHIEQELARFIRYGTPFSLAVCDLDHFKKINDTYGHLVGDMILEHVSRLIQDNIRQSDSFIRFGGEEFIILFANTRLAQAMKAVEKIRHTIENRPLVTTMGTIPVTLSIGLTSPHKTDSTQSLLDRADMALYQAKTGGRNRMEYK